MRRAIGAWAICGVLGCAACASELLRVGFAETDITPPTGFPMAGYYHERLAEGQIDPLKAKAIVFRGQTEQVAIVVCDLTGVSIDLASHWRNAECGMCGNSALRIRCRVVFLSNH